MLPPHFTPPSRNGHAPANGSARRFVTRMPTVLLIDDNAAVRTALEVLLSLQGLDIQQADSPAAGLQILERGDVDLVIQDMNFSRQATSGAEGIELFHRIRGVQPELPIILLTAWTHLETAVDLVKAGAADYLSKPWDDARLLTTVRNLLQLRSALLEKQALARSRRAVRQQLRDRFDLRDLVYDSDAIHEVLVTATQVAPADVPVLITGPNGVGKEVLADIIHANSACADGALVKVNVGALPGELMESELFGAEAGAYTGATKGRREGDA